MVGFLKTPLFTFRSQEIPVSSPDVALRINRTDFETGSPARVILRGDE